MYIRRNATLLLKNLDNFFVIFYLNILCCIKRNYEVKSCVKCTEMGNGNLYYLFIIFYLQNLNF